MQPLTERRSSILQFFFRNPDILKVGFGIQSDCMFKLVLLVAAAVISFDAVIMLSTTFSQNDSFLQFHSVLDLQQVMKRADFGSKEQRSEMDKITSREFVTSRRIFG